MAYGRSQLTRPLLLRGQFAAQQRHDVQEAKACLLGLGLLALDVVEQAENVGLQAEDLGANSGTSPVSKLHKSGGTKTRTKQPHPTCPSCS